MRVEPGDQNSPDASNPSKRRGLLVGVGAAGAAALAAKVLPGAAPAAAETVVAKGAPDTAGGYRLTPHVLRYYETAKG